MEPSPEQPENATFAGPASPESVRACPPGAGPGFRVGRGSRLRSWTGDIVFSVFLSVIIIAYVYQPVRVEGTSMMPLLEDQDRLFISKFAYLPFRYHPGAIHRGDVVVFRYPHDASKNYIKRVIAVPGDYLRIDHGTVSLNGQVLREPYIPPRYQDDRSEPGTVLGPNEYFCMGDNRSISFDSRDFGPVDRRFIYGRAAFIFWPMDQVGVVN